MGGVESFGGTSDDGEIVMRAVLNVGKKGLAEPAMIAR